MPRRMEKRDATSSVLPVNVPPGKDSSASEEALPRPAAKELQKQREETAKKSGRKVDGEASGLRLPTPKHRTMKFPDGGYRPEI